MSVKVGGVNFPWRCFHCDEVFFDSAEAAKHFGEIRIAYGVCIHDEAACQVDIAKYREMQKQLERYRNEDTDLHRQIASLQAHHAAALMRAEEAGYAKGLRDGRALSSGMIRIGIILIFTFACLIFNCSAQLPPLPPPTSIKTNTLSPAAYARYLAIVQARATNPPTAPKTKINLSWSFGSVRNSQIVIFQSGDLTNWQIVRCIAITNNSITLPATNSHMSYIAGVFSQLKGTNQ